MILFRGISLSEALSLKTWASIWSTYAMIDPSYADTRSFGFWIDTGNGISTLIPTREHLIATHTHTLSPSVIPSCEHPHCHTHTLSFLSLSLSLSLWHSFV